MDPKVLEAKRAKIVSFLEELGLDDASTMSNSELQQAVVLLPRTNSSSSSNQSTSKSDSAKSYSSGEHEPLPSVNSSKKSKFWNGMKSRAFKNAHIKKAAVITNAAQNNNGADPGTCYIEEDDAFEGAIIDESCNVMNNSYNNNKHYTPPPHAMQGVSHFQPWGFQDPSQFSGPQEYFVNSGYNSGAPAYGHVTEIHTVSLSQALAKKFTRKK
ncbi:hypothetical protein CPB83DRAFT_903281 [Crepidotus variabilis]|uniref:Uncharacterized protein n=1 Tax=Crepidotus variabilis TaxID=179855 RepID=A0A9P6EPY1_9AGAR|nr:hypothetical protein CPB83DRAFT_903281 [Crepidotus variabilis]